MKYSDKLNELAAALCKFQATLVAVKKTSSGYNYEYADLNECWSVIRLPLADVGLCVVQPSEECEDGVIINTMLLHTSGQFISGKMRLPCKDPSNPQLMGACFTYARRYTLSGMVGLSPVDDDAASVVNAKAPGLSSKQKQYLQSEMKSNDWTVDQLKNYTQQTYNKEPGKLNNIEFSKILDVIKGA